MLCIPLLVLRCWLDQARGSLILCTMSAQRLHSASTLYRGDSYLNGMGVKLEEKTLQEQLQDCMPQIVTA